MGSFEVKLQSQQWEGWTNFGQWEDNLLLCHFNQKLDWPKMLKGNDALNARGDSYIFWLIAFTIDPVN